MNKKIENFIAYSVVTALFVGFSWLLYCMMSTYLGKT